MLEHLEQQKSLTTNQWKIFAAATIGDMLDFFDFYLIGFILAFIVGGWNLTYGQSGAILLSSGIAAPLGSLFWGWMADKVNGGAPTQQPECCVSNWPRNHSDAAPQRRDHLALPRGMSF